LNLPPVFIDNIQNSFGADGFRWLDELPALIAHAAQQWDLTIGDPFLLSYNYVCAATKKDGTEVVLKIGVPNRELISEMTALKLFNGQGACRLLEADDEHAMFLLERLFPGKMLVELEDDEAATHIAAEVMSNIWRTPPQGLPLINLSEWFAELNKLRPRFAGGTGPFPRPLVERVESLLPELFADTTPPVLMHGDFHHFNILSSGNNWVIIDPKGVIGPRGYECGPLLINPWGDFVKHPGARQITERRLAILSEHLGLDQQLILNWATCHALLSAWWDLHEDNTGGEYSMACGEMFLNIHA
jgi:streptomycin 6-kinase